MSLQDAAKHLSAHGRGPDDHLVHMSGREVQSLQKLAQAHGGSLTTNPHTGLPEAGFLDALLPSVIGAGVGIATGNPMLGAAASGMFGFAKSGSLTQGLMAGLAGYGGAGLTAGITPDQVENMFTSGSATGGADAAAAANTPTGLQAPQYGGDISRAQQLNPDMWNNPTPGAADLQGYNPNASPSSSTVPTGPQPSITDTITNNFKNNKMLGAMAAAPALTELTKPATLSGLPTTDQSQVAPYYRYTPGKASPFPEANAQGREQNFFPGQGYTQISRADAQKLYGYADGGMTYGSGIQDPNMQTVPSYDPVVRMASGGTNYDPKTQTYSVDPTSPVNSISSTLAPPASDYGSKSGPGSAANTTATQGDYDNAVSNVNAIGNAISSLGIGSIVSSVLGLNNDNTAPGVVSSPAAAAGDAGSSGDGGGTGTNGSAGGAPGDSGDDGSVSGGGVGGDSASAAHGGLMAAFAHGGTPYNLGGYSDGGRLLRGPGDGVSDSIPATIGHKQPARLADGEFVVPARIVSELGNGSTEAGARKLYAMMDRVQKARGKTTGKNKVATNTRADKYLPA
jgi:hypothetical protein